MRPSAERSIMIAVVCFILTIIISFALSEGWISRDLTMDLEKKKNLVIINLFYVGLILIYCILHAGPLNLMVFLMMLVVANLAGVMIK